MFTNQRGQIESAARLQGRPDVLAKELANALVSGPHLTKGSVSIDPAQGRDGVGQSSAGRGARWERRRGATGRGSAGGLYNVDVPRRKTRLPNSSADALVDALRERQALDVAGPVSLGDTVTQNLRADRARMDSVFVLKRATVNGDMDVGGNGRFKGNATVDGDTRHGGDVTVEGDTFHGGDTYHEGNTYHTGITVQDGPAVFNGPVTIAGDLGQPVTLDLISLVVVTDVFWDGTSLRKTSQVVHVPRLDSGETVDEIIAGTTCEE